MEKDQEAFFLDWMMAPEQSLEERVAGSLLSRELTISVAESCTGGLICHWLTNVSGSSDYLIGGVVSYSNQSKLSLLGVPKETIDRWGAVSEACVQAMATGVRTLMGTDLGLAVSGIAGPTGGTPEKPVGTVHLALAFQKEVSCWKYLFQGDRLQIKRQTAKAALTIIGETIERFDP